MEATDFTVETTDFADIADEFRQRIQRIVYCNVATVGERGRPRSRIMHPIWQFGPGSAAPIGWIGTWLTSVKAQHREPSLKIRQVQRNPYASLAYVADVTKPVYIDCVVEVIDETASKLAFCELARSTPAPLGYDPAEIFGGCDDPRFGVLRLTPSRIALVDFPAPPGKVHVWRAETGA